jgi:class 3 adenylate cyclase/tetratricopeptide (TPR) repeat protein
MAVCPSCGHVNLDTNKFCGECATPLQATPPLTGEERKVVTVLFCDLVGFTTASEAADPEDVRARIGPYHQLLRAEIERFGGIVEKFIGDAAMAVFGAPVAHEDDTERAVRSGLRILEAIEDLNKDDPSPELRVRIGINTGEAVVALGASPERGEGMVAGDVVNTASRLQGAAPVNGVAVGEATYLATKDIFEFEALAPAALKGKSELVPLWKAIAARARFGTDLVRRYAVAFVGRELERDLLTGTFQRSVRDRSVHLVTIVGEPGVGKSRLVAELASFVDDSPALVRWRQGRCLPYGDGITFWALGEIVKAESGILETDRPEAAAAKIDHVVPDENADALWLRQRLRPLVGLEIPPATRQENFAAWRTFLESMAERDPCVFVVEDLHWADQSMLDFLEHVVEYSEGVPMLLVATARPELFEKAPSFGQTARNSNRINLSALTETETVRFVSELLASRVLPAEVQSLIVERSGGNPFYAEEFVRLLRDTGILKREGSAWVLDRDAEIPMPTSVQGLVAARLDTLDSTKKAMLQDASVVGKVFWAGALAEMEERDPEAVAQALHELSRRELVRPSRHSSMKGETEYSFWHALVRDVCYAQIPRARRVAKHTLAAAWIERVAGERAEDLAEILASHYTTALELSTAARKRDDLKELTAAARRFLVLAGDRARGLESASAETSYRRALELTPGPEAGRADILAKLAEVLFQRARYAEADAALEEAIEEFRAQGDVRDAALATARRSVVLWRIGDIRHGELVGEATKLLEGLPPGPELVSVLADQAGDSLSSAEYGASVAHADRAISLAEELGMPEPFRALGFRGASRCNLGDPEGLGDLRHALQLAPTQGLGRDAAVIRSNLAFAIWPIEGPRSSLEANRELVDFSTRRGFEDIVLWATADSLQLLADLGSFDDVLEAGPGLIGRAGEAGDVFALHIARSAMLRVLLARGETERAKQIGGPASDSGAAITDPQLMAIVIPVAAALALAESRPASTLALLAELDRTPNVRNDYAYIRNLPGMVRTAKGAGDPNLGHRLVSGVQPVFPLHEHALASAQALLAETDGDFATAAALFSGAAIRWERFEVPFERSQALLGWGRCLLALGKPAEATLPLRDARESFGQLQARPSLVEIDDLLGVTMRRSS